MCLQGWAFREAMLWAQTWRGALEMEAPVPGATLERQVKGPCPVQKQVPWAKAERRGRQERLEDPWL